VIKVDDEILAVKGAAPSYKKTFYEHTKRAAPPKLLYKIAETIQNFAWVSIANNYD